MASVAILIAAEEPSGPLRGLIDRLGGAGVQVSVVDDLPTAAALARRSQTPVVLLDLPEVGGGEIEDVRGAADMIRRVVSAIPGSLPIAITTGADARAILGCIRAGAADVLDLALEGTATARQAVERVDTRQQERAREIEAYAQQRAVVEDLLKELIRTERRSIDAEDALAYARSGEVASSELRPPTILVVEHERAIADELVDQLEAAGVSTFAYVTGEEALREADTLVRDSGLDLALVAAQLPGIDGLESVRRLRALMPGLPAFLMTSVHDADLAADAADLGVVGFVHKPLGDIAGVVERLSQLAVESLQRTREHQYLARIKERHERVLARYRSLPREP
jgi:DNA-binding NtrC family response regulator